MRVVSVLLVAIGFLSDAQSLVRAQTLIPQALGHWRYVEGIADDRWAALEFDDGAWQRGAAPLGIGEPLLATIIRDGGREMQIDEFGSAVSAREILCVDRLLDLILQQYLVFARSDELMKLNTIDRATHIARYKDRVMTPEQGRNSCEVRCEYFAENFASQEVMLGDVVDLCGAGVCRHRALLFKLMADEASLVCSLVRGNLGSPEKFAGHTWNELQLDNQEVVIVDVMNPQPDFHFPSIGERALRYYMTVAKVPKYPYEH